ncbi:hypothetical protein [Streptomyces sp. NPDC005283]|uniref:hypothetical protein n=1 Tax=Streptomyces sp. NPDC005283 TaxID=3156871 RepID=UPI003455B219
MAAEEAALAVCLWSALRPLRHRRPVFGLITGDPARLVVAQALLHELGVLPLTHQLPAALGYRPNTADLEVRRIP